CTLQRPPTRLAQPTRAARLSLRCSLAHRDLHSFPTRRSSDLAREPNFPRQAVAVRDGLHAAFAVPVGVGPETLGERGVEPVADRSEEHTSELQSLRHLVCRLLLEKKKKHNTLYRTHVIKSYYS